MIELLRGCVSYNCTRVCGSTNGSGRRSTPLTTLKIAVLAPIPIGIVAIAATVKARALPQLRSAKRRS
jgi:hypothetical protein